MWDKDLAELHYQDLVRIKERLEKDKSANEHRMKVIDDLLKIADHERNETKKDSVEFYR